MITADGGGSNGRRNKLWKTSLQGFANESGLEIHVPAFLRGHQNGISLNIGYPNRQKMSRAALADKANISLSQVSNIETGKSSMRLTAFIGIVEALQVSADDILRTDIPEVNNICKSEFAEVLEDCPPTEIESILKIVREVNKPMHSPKGNTDY